MTMPKNQMDLVMDDAETEWTEKNICFRSLRNGWQITICYSVYLCSKVVPWFSEFNNNETRIQRKIPFTAWFIHCITYSSEHKFLHTVCVYIRYSVSSMKLIDILINFIYVSLLWTVHKSIVLAQFQSHSTTEGPLAIEIKPLRNTENCTNYNRWHSMERIVFLLSILFRK